MNAILSIYGRMNVRERALAAISAIAVVGYLLFQAVGGGDDSDSAWSVSAADVESARENYETQVEVVASAPKVTAQFVSVVGRGAVGESEEGRRPDLDFQNEVAEWCKQIGMPTPDFELDHEKIKDVDDYEMVAVTTFVRDADMARISRLLKIFELHGVIVQEVKLSSRLDSPSMDATVRAARIVPQF